MNRAGRVKFAPPNPSGLCMCGCGGGTSIAPRSSSDRGNVKGEPVRYIAGHQNRKPDEARYKVEDRGYETPCWIWQLGRRGGFGYGGIRSPAEDRNVYAHRFFWEREHGPVPDGLQLDHLCRNPPCVNPDHLEPVTPAENVRRSRTALLTLDQVRGLRVRAAASSTPPKALAREWAADYGVCAGTLEAIFYGRIWKEAA